MLYLYTHYAKKGVVFLKNLHSWQEFYTTVGQILTLYLVFSKIWKNTRQKCDAGRGKVLQNLLPDSFFANHTKKKNKAEAKCGLMTRG